MQVTRFVVQEHTTAEGVHWDLMFEQGQVLTTFRLAEPPEHVLQHAVEATRISDHALRFLSYEGPVQKETGRVRIVDRGAFHLRLQEGDALAFELEGSILNGDFELNRSGKEAWTLTRKEAGA